MRNLKREIECLQRLHLLNVIYADLLQFLLEENLIDKHEIKLIQASTDQAKLLQKKLADLSRDGKLQLLEYEWTLLPTERIKLSLVTNSNHREFEANV